MSDEQKNTEKKNTGLFHDDDGNWDDKRVAAWVFTALIFWLAYQGTIAENNVAAQMFDTALWATILLFGIEVTEKFSGRFKK